MAWNQSNGIDGSGGRARDGKRNGPLLRGAAAAAIVVIGAVGVWFALAPSPEGEAPEAVAPAGGRVAEAKATAQPKTAGKPAEAPRPASTNSPKWEAAVGLDPKLFPYKDGRKVLESRTNEWNQIIDICMMPYGKTRKVIREAKPRPFQTATDQLIALAIAGNNDEAVPPIPLGDNLEAEFFESLQHPIVINDDDSEEVRRMKENVIEARKVIDERLRQGQSFRSVLEEHLAQRKRNAEMREHAMDSVREFKDGGDPGMVKEYVKRVNAMLREKGVGEIGVPMSRRERLEARERQSVSEEGGNENE